MADSGLKQFFSDKVTDTSATALHTPGIIRFEGNDEYRYVQIVDKAVTLGDSLCPASTADGIVTADRAGGSQLARVARGVAVGSIASGYYGWILKKGIAVIQCDGGVSSNEGVIPHVTSDGHADSCDESTVSTNTAFRVFGVALTDDAGASDGDTATAYINCD